MELIKFFGVVLVVVIVVLLLISFIRAALGKRGTVSYEDTHQEPRPPRPPVPKSTGSSGRKYLTYRRRNS